MTSESRRQRKGENYKRKKDLNERPSNPTRYLHDKDKLASTHMRGIQDPCEKREGLRYRSLRITHDNIKDRSA